MALLVGGRLIIRRDGAGLSIGFSTALWGIPMGLGNSPVYNLALYALVGGALDVMVRMPGIRLDHPLWAPICGGIAHLTKLGFIAAYALSFGLNRRFWEAGLSVSAGYHFLFGALGGLVAVIVWGLATRAKRG